MIKSWLSIPVISLLVDLIFCKNRQSSIYSTFFFVTHIHSGPHEEEEGPQHGEIQVRREVQDRQEQMVLPEA